MDDFTRSLTRNLTSSLRRLPTPPPVNAPRPSGVGLGSDSEQYVEMISPTDASTTARKIIEAAKLAKAGGPAASTPLSSLAQQIIAAGKKARGG